jgi:hypothetical protein
MRTPAAKEFLTAMGIRDPEAVRRLAAEHPGLVAEVQVDHPNLVTRTAMAWNATEMVRALLDVGFDPNETRETFISELTVWGTALHYAARHGDLELARLLIEHGADPDSRDCIDSKTPVEWASDPAMVALLSPRTGT